MRWLTLGALRLFNTAVLALLVVVVLVLSATLAFANWLDGEC